MKRLPFVFLENFNPIWGEVHINEQLHAVTKGSSISSARQAA